LSWFTLQLVLVADVVVVVGADVVVVVVRGVDVVVVVVRGVDVVVVVVVCELELEEQAARTTPARARTAMAVAVFRGRLAR
jgi:hypothetical protein